VKGRARVLQPVGCEIFLPNRSKQHGSVLPLPLICAVTPDCIILELLLLAKFPTATPLEGGKIQGNRAVSPSKPFDTSYQKKYSFTTDEKVYGESTSVTATVRSLLHPFHNSKASLCWRVQPPPIFSLSLKTPAAKFKEPFHRHFFCRKLSSKTMSPTY
jgi:hypothetical protein